MERAIGRAMLDKGKIFVYLDWAIVILISLLIFCLPFAKAGIEFSVWFAIFLWLLKRILGYRAVSLWGMLPKTKLNKALGIFVIFSVLSMIFSMNLGLSLRGFFGKELKFLAIYFMLVEVINTKERLRVILVTVIASTILILADAGVQYFHGVDFLRGYPLELLRGPFLSHNGFGGWLAVVILLFFGLLAASKRKRVRFKLPLLILLALLLICLLGTYSRGAWFGFVIGFAAMIYYYFEKLSLKVKVLFLSLAVSFLVIFLFLPQAARFKISSIGRVNFKFNETVNTRLKESLKTEEGSSTSIRVKLWQEALKMAADYPLTGCGLNTYSIVGRDYKSFSLGGTYPHNSYLQMLVERGLFGFFSFLLVLFVFFKRAINYLRQRRDYLVLGLLAGVLAFLVHAFFDTHFYSLQLVVLFWYILGLTIAAINLGERDIK